MTLQQMTAVRRWHLAHHRHRSVEYQVWDAVLTCWMLGWMGVAPAVLVAPGLGVAACIGLFFTPAGYVRLRAWLHRRRLLRCDWLDSARRP